MANQLTCLTAEQAQLAACAKANGWPSGPGQYFGAVTPEANWTGYWPNDLYFDTEAEILYAFNGTPGENTGWVAINP